MPTGISILRAENAPHDGFHFDVTLDGQPQGTLGFRIAPIPDVSKAVTASFMAGGGSGVWRLTCAHPGLWYVWASDSEGVMAAPAGVWVGLTDNPDLEECGLALEKILTDNKAGIEAALRANWFPEATLKHIVYGTSTGIFDYPAILITSPREQVDYVAFPYVREHTFRLEIYIYFEHQDPASLLTAATRTGARLMEVLNKPEYEGIVLPSGTPLAFCGATEGESGEVQIDTNLWAATGSCVWSGKAMKQSAGEAGV